MPPFCIRSIRCNRTRRPWTHHACDVPARRPQVLWSPQFGRPSIGENRFVDLCSGRSTNGDQQRGIADVLLPRQRGKPRIHGHGPGGRRSYAVRIIRIRWISASLSRHLIQINNANSKSVANVYSSFAMACKMGGHGCGSPYSLAQ